MSNRKGKFIQLAKLRTGERFNLSASPADAAEEWEVVRHFTTVQRVDNGKGGFRVEQKDRTRVRRLHENRTLRTQEPLSTLMVFVAEEDE